MDQGKIMAACINQFCETSGNKFSRSKTRIFFSKNTETSVREEIYNELSMAETDDLGTYLGTPTINGRTSNKGYQFFVDRINIKLTGWKTKNISMVGRATLV